MTPYGLLLLLSAFVADAKAVIEAPSKATAGDLVVLDASKSVGSQFVWVLANSTKSHLPVNDGRQCAFAARQPGRYVFVLIVADANEEGKLDVSVAKHELNLTNDDVTPPNPPDPPPEPPDPDDPPKPPPNPTTLSGKCELWAHELRLPEIDRKRDSLRLGAAFLEVASQIAAGVIRDPNEIPNKIAGAVTRALGTRSTLWEPWAEKLVDELNVLDTQGKLNVIRDYLLAMEAIAAGLERAGGMTQKHKRTGGARR